MLIVIAKNGFAGIVPMGGSYRWNYPLITKMLPKVAHCNGSEDDLMVQFLLNKALHQALIDYFSGFYTDCPRVVVELTHDPQNSLTVPPGVAELMQPARQCVYGLRKRRLAQPP